MGFSRKLFKAISPPRAWRLLVLITTGILTGLFFFLLHISRATSYLSDKPETCINCHVMYPQYASWTKGSHGNVASCSDCHVPQDNIFRKYWTKATDGLWHATVFTMRWEPQVIQIRDPGINVVQENCIRCHIDLVDMTSLITVTGDLARHNEGKLCWDCHRETPHGTVRSLSAAPHALVERLPSVMPEWLNNFLSAKETDE